MESISQRKDSSFMKASIIMSLLAFLTVNFILPPFIFGGLAILFAILDKGARPKLSGIGIISIITSVTAMLVTLLTTAFVMQIIMTNPEYRQQLNDYSEQIYGQTYDEMLEEIKGAY